MDKIDKGILSLAQFNRYYTYVLSNFVKIEHPKVVPTMGVGFTNPKNPKIALYYNPEWVNTLTDIELGGVILHEVFHILFNHIPRFSYTDSRLAKLANIATDMSINPLVGEAKLPKGGAWPKAIKMKNNLSAEEYYAELLKQNENALESSGGSHTMWGKALGEDGNMVDVEISESELESQIAQGALRAYRANNNSFGNCPSNMISRLEELLFKSNYNWKRELRIFSNTIITSKAKSSYRKVNRRYHRLEYVVPGVKRHRRPKILIARDTSGSCYDSKTQLEFLKEVIAIVKNADITVVDCDTNIAHVFKPKKVSDFKEFKGGGGTSFEPVFTYAKDNKFEGVIYLTDTYGSFPDKEKIGRLANKTIWVTFGEDKVNLPFGKHVNIPESK